MQVISMQMVLRQHFYKALIDEFIKISSLAVFKINTCFLIPAIWTLFLTHLVILGRLKIRLKDNTLCSKLKWNSEDTATFICLEKILSEFIINVSGVLLGTRVQDCEK